MDYYLLYMIEVKLDRTLEAIQSQAFALTALTASLDLLRQSILDLTSRMGQSSLESNS